MIQAFGHFILGNAIGLVVAFLVFSVNIPNYKQRQKSTVRSYRNNYNKATRTPHRKMTLENDMYMHHDDDSVAKKLEKEVRVLIWVMTTPSNLETKARIVKDTWARKCNKVIFFSSEDNATFPAIGLNVSEGRYHLTAKTMNGFRYIYEHHFNDADWFMKTDDDTYVVVENLRYFLSGKNTSEPVYLGHHFNDATINQGFHSGGGGYVLSKEALRRLGSKGNDSSVCSQDGGSEDLEMGRCLEKLGVRTADSTDSMGRHRFNCFAPENHLLDLLPKWYYKSHATETKKGQEAISDYAISFHYISPANMLELYFYIYHLRPFGINTRLQDFNSLEEKGPQH